MIGVLEWVKRVGLDEMDARGCTYLEGEAMLIVLIQSTEKKMGGILEEARNLLL